MLVTDSLNLTQTYTHVHTHKHDSTHTLPTSLRPKSINITCSSHTHTHTHPQTHTYTHTQTHTHTHTQTHTSIHTHSHIHTHIKPHTHIHKHTLTHTHKHTHTHTYTHTRTHAHTHKHTHTHTHTYTHSHACTHTQTHTHTHTHTHTQTHTHKYQIYLVRTAAIHQHQMCSVCSHPAINSFCTGRQLSVRPPPGHKAAPFSTNPSAESRISSGEEGSERPSPTSSPQQLLHQEEHVWDLGAWQSEGDSCCCIFLSLAFQGVGIILYVQRSRHVLLLCGAYLLFCVEFVRIAATIRLTRRLFPLRAKMVQTSCSHHCWHLIHPRMQPRCQGTFTLNLEA